MPRMTVSVPDELLSRLKKAYPEINWASVVRSVIIKKLIQLERLVEKGEL